MTRRIRVVISLVFFSLLLVPVPNVYSAVTPEVNDKFTIRKVHPRLFITKETLENIRQRCTDRKNAQARYYGILKKFADNYILGKKSPSASSCICFALLYAMGELPGYDYSKRSANEYGRLGVELLVHLYPPRDLSYFVKYTPNFIACYDWLFSAMSPEERVTVFKNYTSVCDKMQLALQKTIGNRFRGTREMYAYYGLAFYGDGKYLYPNNQVAAAEVDHKAQEYCDDFVLRQINEQLAIFETACKGGANPDGTMYGEAPYPTKLWPFYAWKTAADESLYEETSCLTGYPLFWLYQMLPYRTAVRYDCANGRADQPGGLVRFGDYRYIGHTAVAGPQVNIAQAQGVAVEQNRRDLAAAFNWLIQYRGDFKVMPFGGPFPANKWVGAGPALVWDIVFRDGLVAAKSPKAVHLPLAYHFGSIDSGFPLQPDFPNGRPEGTGVVVMRSSWDDPDGTLLWFKSSSHMLSHSHRDQGSFQIYKKGWLAIDSGQYEETSHRGNYSMRTVAHNCLLVYNPDERLDQEKVDSVWYGFANDGGQRWAPGITTVAEAKGAKDFLGGVTRFESVPEVYDYVHADITRSYNSVNIVTEGHKPKVSLVSRSMIFLRPDEYIILFDRVRSTNSELPKRWLLHSIYRPELNGKETFDGVIPYSKNIPGKPVGVKLRGSMLGGLSESKSTDIITLKAWNFGPADGRLVCRTLLPEKHITRVVGGSDIDGIRKTVLAKSHAGGNTITVENIDGFGIGDFVYLGESFDPYTHVNRGRPHWPVDDIFYNGWGKIQNVNTTTKVIIFKPWHYSVPKLAKGTVVMRSGHANEKSFEFMDAEYTQWPMEGETVANAGPFQMQHGCWRVEVEPIEKKKEDIFLHVMLPCDSKTVHKSQVLLKESIKLSKLDDSITLNIEGRARDYKITFHLDSPDANIIVREGNETIVNNLLSNEVIKSRQ